MSTEPDPMDPQSTRIYRLQRVTETTELSAGDYVICRGREALHVRLREPMSVFDMSTVIEKISLLSVVRLRP